MPNPYLPSMTSAKLRARKRDDIAELSKIREIEEATGVMLPQWTEDKVTDIKQIETILKHRSE